MWGAKTAALLAALALPLAAQGQIYKCTNGAEHVTYQDTLCPAGVEGMRLSIRGGRAIPASTNGPSPKIEALAQFRLSAPTPFLDNNDGKIDTALNAPSLQPGTTIFITEMDRVGSTAWFHAFRQIGGQRDFGWISYLAIIGQDESLPLIDWNNALAESEKVSRAAALSNNFSALPKYDIA